MDGGNTALFNVAQQLFGAKMNKLEFLFQKYENEVNRLKPESESYLTELKRLWTKYRLEAELTIKGDL